MRSGQRLQELLEGRLEEGIVLILTHLHSQDDESSEALRKLLKMQSLELAVFNMYAGLRMVCVAFVSSQHALYSSYVAPAKA